MKYCKKPTKRTIGIVLIFQFDNRIFCSNIKVNNVKLVLPDGHLQFCTFVRRKICTTFECGFLLSWTPQADLSVEQSLTTLYTCPGCYPGYLHAFVDTPNALQGTVCSIIVLYSIIVYLYIILLFRRRIEYDV